MINSREELLEKLKAKKSRCQESLNTLIKSQKDNATQQSEDCLKDEFDCAQREISVHNNYSLIEKKTKELEKIELLIKQISNSETYGLCEECDDPIPPERLLFVPEASLCVPCQRELERFDRMRKPVTLNSSGSVRRRHLEWETSRESDEIDDGPAHSDIDIFPSSEIDEVPYPSLHQEKNPEHILEENAINSN